MTQNQIRQISNLVLAPLMWVLSSLGIFYAGARSPQDFSDMSANLLVPSGFAFSIWFPIFVGCIAYGVVQALRKNRERTIFQQAGWWTAGGFAGVCAWSLITAFAPNSLVQWGSALVFVPTMLCLVKAMLILTRHKSKLTRGEALCTWLPINLIAGWTSIAVFLNWMPIVSGFTGASVPLLFSSLIVLGAALIWAIFIIRKSGGNLAYMFPIVWGLGFLALRHFTAGQVQEIAIAALIGIGALIIAQVWKPRML